ncbi:hypothetical protein B0A48_18179 [Cryoendolithus antarcticus]|uniref:Uncharacterized protein n=1 Tax=Cryoendolithus antarcticus TaxID=1507870 RepID=A0A1V8S909_9PEZI|nr:hypothetical protein B0A48_18179 [Cryoendolithus antarcticus]
MPPKRTGEYAYLESKPQASQLVLLSQVAGMSEGSKVRFLGCVSSYDVPSATLIFEDHAAISRRSTVLVNVDGITSTLNAELTQIGALLNVVGYVDHRSVVNASEKKSSANVNALMIWSAGAVKVDEYETAVRDMQSTCTT